MKAEISSKVLMGIGAAAAVVIVGLLIYFFRASDPAARPPIPYKKFDYGAHVQQLQQQYNRQTPPASGASQSGSPATP